MPLHGCTLRRLRPSAAVGMILPLQLWALVLPLVKGRGSLQVPQLWGSLGLSFSMTRSCNCGLQILVHKETQKDFYVLLDGVKGCLICYCLEGDQKLFLLVPGKGCGPAETIVAGLGQKMRRCEKVTCRSEMLDSVFLLSISLQSQRSLGCDSIPLCRSLALECCSLIPLKG